MAKDHGVGDPSALLAKRSAMATLARGTPVLSSHTPNRHGYLAHTVLSVYPREGSHCILDSPYPCRVLLQSD